MARCTRTTNLEIHHKNRYGDNSLSNAEVLCHKCHVATHTFAIAGVSPPDFNQDTKDKALKRADNRCECERTGGCH